MGSIPHRVIACSKCIGCADGLTPLCAADRVHLTACDVPNQSRGHTSCSPGHADLVPFTCVLMDEHLRQSSGWASFLMGLCPELRVHEAQAAWRASDVEHSSSPEPVEQASGDKVSYILKHSLMYCGALQKR